MEGIPADKPGHPEAHHAADGLDDALIAKIEVLAIELVRGAGLILDKYRGAPLEVVYKDKHKRDPVTAADRECQEYLAEAVSRNYPDHGFLGEEDGEPDEKTVPNFVWVVDPLDGTKNFIGGLPIYACSIGVLYQGAPIVGAIYIPWPGEGGGLVMHARKGGGAFVGSERVSVFGGNKPDGHGLVALPAPLVVTLRASKPLREKVGEVRVTGSIAYELAMTASGVLEYMVTTGPRLWDIAGGVVLVMEAGGAVMVGRHPRGLKGLATAKMQWEPLVSFMPSWHSGTTTLGEMRRWSAPLVLGSPEAVRHSTEDLRSGPALRRRLALAVRQLRRGARTSRGPG